MKRISISKLFQCCDVAANTAALVASNVFVHTLGAFAFASFLPVGSDVVAAGQGVYPSKAIRIVVAFAPGAGTDLSIRTISPKLSEALGQQIIVDNRVGASGIVGTEIVAKAPPDGYTLLFTTTDLAINSALFATLPYDPLKDFAAIGRLSNIPFFLVVNSDLPVKNLQELMILAKSRSPSLTYASAGSGTPPHIAAEMFKQATRLDLVHVPYKGSAQALTDVISGQIQVMFVNTASSIQYVRGGRLRALGITTTQRIAAAPDIPTIVEAGLAGYEFVVWQGMVAPAATPRDIVSRLNRELVHAVETADVRERLMSQGTEPAPSTPEQFAQLIAADTERLGRVAKAAKMRLD